MFTAALIVFREIFEIAIIVTVILAATRKLPYRNWCVTGGIAAGSMLVAIIALFARGITELATHLGQHLFHALILFIAASLISWSVIWMQQHGRQIVLQMREMSQSVQNGSKPLYMLAVVVALAVLREGSEIVLFLYGIYSTGDASIADITYGSILGTGAGLITGLIMYLGLIKIPVKQLFQISGWLLTFLAAGMVAKAIGHLVKADMLPSLLNPIWDTSSLISQHSIVGRFLSIVVGYQDQPAGIQVVFYLMTLIFITMTLKLKTK